METITGVIEEISSKTGTSAKGPWTRFGIKVDGHTISSFDKVVAGNLEQGKRYTFECERKGDFLNLAQGTTPQEVGEQPDSGMSRPASGYQDSKDQSIRRQVALKCAVELTHHIMAHSNKKYAGVSKVLSIATRFDAWLNGAEDFEDIPTPEGGEEVAWKDLAPTGTPDAPDANSEDAPGEAMLRDAIRERLQQRQGAGESREYLLNLLYQFDRAKEVAGIPADRLEEALNKLREDKNSGIGISHTAE